MPDQPSAPDPSAPERNPLGLGPRDRESSNTGSTADTSYDARDSDPYTTGEPFARAGDAAGGASDSAPDSASRNASTPADPAVPSSDEP